MKNKILFIKNPQTLKLMKELKIDPLLSLTAFCRQKNLVKCTLLKLKRKGETPPRAGGIYSRRDFYFYASNMHFSFPKCDIGVAGEDEVNLKGNKKYFMSKQRYQAPRSLPSIYNNFSPVCKTVYLHPALSQCFDFYKSPWLQQSQRYGFPFASLSTWISWDRIGFSLGSEQPQISVA